MEDKMTTSRREALGLASVAVAAFSFGATSAAAAKTASPRSARPTAEDLERVKHLYGGELGGTNREGR